MSGAREFGYFLFSSKSAKAAPWQVTTESGAETAAVAAATAGRRPAGDARGAEPGGAARSRQRPAPPPSGRVLAQSAGRRERGGSRARRASMPAGRAEERAVPVPSADPQIRRVRGQASRLHAIDTTPARWRESRSLDARGEGGVIAALT